MIKRKDYLNALELIDKYHHQQNGRIKISDFMEEHLMNMSVRLYNALQSAVENKWFEYIEELDFENATKIRNFGMKSWKELCEIRNIDP